MLWEGVCDISMTVYGLWGTDHVKRTRSAPLNGQKAGGIFAGRGEHRN